MMKAVLCIKDRIILGMLNLKYVKENERIVNARNTAFQHAYRSNIILVCLFISRAHMN